MTLGEWMGAAVDPAGGDEPPAPSEWHVVEVPGQPERFAGEEAVAYKTQFSDPRETADERAVLDLRGVFARARVWCNGELLGEHGTYFAPARFELDLEDENEIVVECRAPDDRFAGVHGTDLVPESAAVPGIWWDASVETRPASHVASLSVSPRFGDDGAFIDASVTVDAAESVDGTVTFSVRPEGFRGGGMMERAPVAAGAGDRVTVEKSIRVRDPAYWWPREYGPQHQYTVRAKLGDSVETAKTGLARIRYGDDGLTVNGHRVPARGFNFLPTGDPTWDVERAANANANLVRVHAHVPPTEFYEACNDAGVLVWQDLPLTGPGEYDVERAKELAGVVASATERHPSVGLFGVHDDPADPLDGIGPSRLARYKIRWRAWRSDYDDSADADVAAVFPEGTPVFPVSGGPGIGADATNLYPGWSYGDASDAEWLLDRYPDLGGVVGEFGAGALAGGEVEEAAGFDRAKHDAYVSGGVEESQAYQARALKTVAETLRREEADVMAAFALRDTDAAGMGVLTADGDEKAGYPALAASFEPVQTVLTEYPTSGKTTALVLNDTAEEVSCSVSWTAGDRSGGRDVTVEPFGRAGGGTVHVPDGAEAVELRLSLPEETVTNTYPL